MRQIEITEDLEKIIKIGKELKEEKSNIYQPNVLLEITGTIDKYMPESSEEVKDAMLYRSIYDYWVYGNTISEEFYMGLKDKSHEEKLAYVPFRWRMKFVDFINDRKDEHFFRNKYEAYQLLKPYYLRDVIQVQSDDDYPLFLEFIDKHPVFVVKPTSLSYGVGVYKVDSSETENKHELYNRILASGRDITKNYKWSKNDTVVLEEIINQVEELSAIHPYSVNGIRISTLRVGEKVHIVYPWFKIGANKEFVTSAALGTYDAGIDPLTGIVNTDGFKEDGSSESVHPMTGFRFKGYQIPKWDELVDMISKIALRLPNVAYIGWDVVLTPKGWCIMEGNYSGEFMWQMFRQEGFRKELEELTGWKPGNGFWWE